MGRASVLDRFPVDGSVELDGESLPTPYRVSDGTMLMVAGTCDPVAATRALEPLGLRPISTTDGRALAAVWVADFTDAGLGPHGELQVSLLTAPGGCAPVSPGPWAVYEGLAGDHPVWMLCHTLWNTTPRVVRYNDEHLGLEVALAEGGLVHQDGSWSFAFTDQAGRPIAQGSGAAPRRTAVRDTASLVRALGWTRARRLAGRPDQSIGVLSPRRTADGDVLVASTYTQSERAAFRPWGAGDELGLPHPELASLDFRPELSALLGGVRFVYLRPTPHAVAG